MYKKRLIIWTFLITFLIFSCEKEKDTISKQDAFPLKVGNEWTYSYKIELSNIVYSHDSLTDRFDSIIEKQLSVEILEMKLNEGIETFQIASSDGFLIYFEYYISDKEGLKYDFPTHHAGLDSYGIFPHSGYDWFCNNPFYKWQLDIKKSKSIKATNDLEEGQNLVVKYPLTIGDKWITDEFAEIEKSVSGLEQINISNTNYDCYVIDYLFLNDSSMITRDYVSDKGLIKRIRNIDNVNLGYNCYADYKEEWIMTDCQLIE